MKTFNRSKFESLASITENYCISIYIPTQLVGENRDKGMTRLKNHIANVQKELEELGLKPREIKDYLKPINALVGNTNLWRYLDDSLVVFSSKEKIEYYTLPVQVEEFSMVSDRYHMLPLMPFFNKKDSFYILSLSQNQNKLYQATQHEITEIETGESFPSASDAIGRGDGALEVNIRSVGSVGAGGEAHFFGKDEVDKHKSEIRLYLQAIDKALTSLIGVDGDPLVIASVDYMFGYFREYSTYKNIYPEFISGNFDHEGPSFLHEKAKEVLQAYFKETKTDKKEALIDGNVKQTSNLEEIVLAADAGSIRTLFVARNRHIWGSYTPKKAKVEIHTTKQPLDNCLLDLAARETFLKGGKVFLVGQEQLLDKETLALAALRY